MKIDGNEIKVGNILEIDNAFAEIFALIIKGEIYSDKYL